MVICSMNLCWNETNTENTKITSPRKFQDGDHPARGREMLLLEVERGIISWRKRDNIKITSIFPLSRSSSRGVEWTVTVKYYKLWPGRISNVQERNTARGDSRLSLSVSVGGIYASAANLLRLIEGKDHDI